MKYPFLITAIFAVFVAKGQEKSKLPSSSGTNNEQVNNLSNGASEDVVNVDMYTGTAGASIPIYSYSVDGLDFGVSVNYNAKGIKVDDIASEVGLGWSLNIGGSIERQVYGIEDEVVIPASIVQGGYNRWQQGTWPIEQYPGSSNGPFTSADLTDDQYDVFNANFCGRSIKFGIRTYPNENNSLPSKWKIFTMPRSEIKIDFVKYHDDNTFQVVSPTPGSLERIFGASETYDYIGFNITDEKGNIFKFIRGDYQRKPWDLTEAGASPATGIYYPITKWVLAEVETYSGKKVKYTYSTTNIKYSQYIDQDKMDDPEGAELYIFKNSVEKWDGKVSHVNKIEYPNGVNVLFDISNNFDIGRCDLRDVSTNSAPYLLKGITIRDGRNQDLINNTYNDTKYKFSYSYFNAGSAIPIPNSLPCSTISSNYFAGYSSAVQDSLLHYNLRLKLDAITKEAGISSEPYYSFDYNVTSTLSLPPRLHPSRDFWGYYNDKSTTVFDGIKFQIPKHTYTVTYSSTSVVTYEYGTDRTPDFDKAKANVLTKIKNGLGGTIELQYQDYTLSNPSCSYGNNNYLGNWDKTRQGLVSRPTNGCAMDPAALGNYANDGLCIHKIIKKDGFSDDNTVVTQYTFSGGERFFYGGYFWYLDVSDNDDYSPAVKYRWRNSFVNAMDLFNGSNHGFSYCTVEKFGFNNQRISKSRFQFSNMVDHPNDLSHPESYLVYETGLKLHTYFRNSMDQYKMGLLIERQDYDENDFVVSKQINEYQFPSFSNHVIKSTIATNTDPALQNTSIFYYYHSIWGTKAWAGGTVTQLIEPNIALLSKTTNIRYSGNSQMTTTYEYEYDNRDNIKMVKWKDSKGDEYKKESLYSYEYSSLPMNSCSMASIHLQFKVGERVYKYYPSQSQWLLLSHSIDKPYSYTSSSGCKILFNESYKPTITSPINVTTAAANESAALTGSTGLSSLIKSTSVTKYSAKNYPLEIKHDELNEYSSAIWDDRIGSKVADVNNARYDHIAYTSFEGPSNLTAENKGNWSFDESRVVLASTTARAATTGKYTYRLGEGYEISKVLQPNDYILTFWSDISPVVKLGGTTIPTTSAVVLTAAGINLYRLKISTSTQQTLTIAKNGTSGLSGFIDELRIHPVNSTITTYTYEPGRGVSSVSDNNNNIIHTQYDQWGRPWRSLDMFGNILSQIDYTVQGNK